MVIAVALLKPAACQSEGGAIGYGGVVVSVQRCAGRSHPWTCVTVGSIPFLVWPENPTFASRLPLRVSGGWATRRYVVGAEDDGYSTPYETAVWPHPRRAA
jgi:hypothetical protein